MIRVELISKRVDLVENIVAEVKQTPLKSKGEDASSRPFNDFDQVVLQAERIMTDQAEVVCQFTANSPAANSTG